MSGPIFASQQALQEHRLQQVETLLKQGNYDPMLMQYALGSLVLLLIPLLLRYRDANQSRLVRYLFFSIIFSFTFFIIRNVRSSGLCNGYFVGMITGWFLVWSATLLIFNDPQKSFKRIEKLAVVDKDTGRNTTIKIKGDLKDIDKSKMSNNSSQVVSQPSDMTTYPVSSHTERVVYRWQPYPESRGHRLDWSLDLIFNFRGPEWNWRVTSLPPLPHVVAKDLASGEPSIELRQDENHPKFEDPWSRLNFFFRKFLLEYIALDIIKLVMNRDPYFWSDVTVHPEPPFPFSYLSFSPILVQAYRLLVSTLGTCTALDFVTTLNPLCFLGLSLLYPQLSRKITRQPLDEAWLYPDVFGAVGAFFDHGLAGGWGEAWHQLFRFGFSESARFVTELLFSRVPYATREVTGAQMTDASHGSCKMRSRDLKARRIKEKVVQTLVAFSVSGFIHACGSYTQIGPTRPLSGPFLFFILQGIGIVLQRFLSRTVLPTILRVPVCKLPRTLRRATNFIYATNWILITGTLMTEDFARGGIWHFEPVPISPIRWILGLWDGKGGGGWWCWHGPYFGWWEEYDSDGKLIWWRSGVRIL